MEVGLPEVVVLCDERVEHRGDRPRVDRHAERVEAVGPGAPCGRDRDHDLAGAERCSPSGGHGPRQWPQGAVEADVAELGPRVVDQCAELGKVGREREPQRPAVGDRTGEPAQRSRCPGNQLAEPLVHEREDREHGNELIGRRRERLCADRVVESDEVTVRGTRTVDVAAGQHQ